MIKILLITLAVFGSFLYYVSSFLFNMTVLGMTEIDHMQNTGKPIVYKDRIIKMTMFICLISALISPLTFVFIDKMTSIWFTLVAFFVSAIVSIILINLYKFVLFLFKQ